jgi:M-phase inducer tyrosine phosphatase
MLEGLGLGPSKRLRRPIALTSAMGIIAVSQLNSAHPILSGQDNQESRELLPPRRAFSAMLPPTALNVPASPSDEGSSFDLPDMSSPAQAYTKRQQTKTLRRCDGSDNLRPMPTHRGTPSKENSPRQLFNENSPSARWLMPGFGDNEAHGKILPCHRVKEDGLMRISSKTVSQNPSLENLVDLFVETSTDNILASG